MICKIAGGESASPEKKHFHNSNRVAIEYCLASHSVPGKSVIPSKEHAVFANMLLICFAKQQTRKLRTYLG
jgi:hypothetical protein